MSGNISGFEFLNGYDPIFAISYLESSDSVYFAMGQQIYSLNLNNDAVAILVASLEFPIVSMKFFQNNLFVFTTNTTDGMLMLNMFNVSSQGLSARSSFPSPRHVHNREAGKKKLIFAPQNSRLSLPFTFVRTTSPFLTLISSMEPCISHTAEGFSIRGFLLTPFPDRTTIQAWDRQPIKDFLFPTIPKSTFSTLGSSQFLSFLQGFAAAFLPWPFASFCS